MKLRNETIKFGHKFNTETVYINSQQAFVRTFQIYTGADILNATITGVSLNNQADRAIIKRFANKLLELTEGAS